MLKKCHSCGSLYRETYETCPKCGYYESPNDPIQKKSRKTLDDYWLSLLERLSEKKDRLIQWINSKQKKHICEFCGEIAYGNISSCVRCQNSLTAVEKENKLVPSVKNNYQMLLRITKNILNETNGDIDWHDYEDRILKERFDFDKWQVKEPFKVGIKMTLFQTRVMIMVIVLFLALVMAKELWIGLLLFISLAIIPNIFASQIREWTARESMTCTEDMISYNEVSRYSSKIFEVKHTEIEYITLTVDGMGKPQDILFGVRSRANKNYSMFTVHVEEYAEINKFLIYLFLIGFKHRIAIKIKKPQILSPEQCADIEKKLAERKEEVVHIVTFKMTELEEFFQEFTWTQHREYISNFGICDGMTSNGEYWMMIKGKKRGEVMDIANRDPLVMLEDWHYEIIEWHLNIES